MSRSQKRDQQQLHLKEVSDCFREIRCFLWADDHLLGIGGQGTQLVNNKGDDGP